MAAQKGRDLLLKIDDGGGGFATVAGLRTRSLSLNAETVDITHSQSTGAWRELLAGGGVRRAALSGSGVFTDDAADDMVRAQFFDAVILDWQVIVPDFGTIAGAFQIASLDYAGRHDGELTFDIALESAGALTFSAA